MIYHFFRIHVNSFSIVASSRKKLYVFIKKKKKKQDFCQRIFCSVYVCMRVSLTAMDIARISHLCPAMSEGCARDIRQDIL